MLAKRVLFWAALAAGAAAYAHARAPRAGGPPSAGRLEGRLVGPVRRTRSGWRTLFEVPDGSGTTRGQLWLPKGVDPAAFAPGRAVTAFGRPRLPRVPRDPGDDDEDSRVRASGASWVLRAERAAGFVDFYGIASQNT